MSAPLYKLVEQHRELERFADETDVDPQALKDTLDGLKGDIEIKAQSVASFIRNIEADADAIRKAAQQMQERAKRLQERADAIRNYLLVNMQATGISKISCPHFTITLRKNPPSVVIENEAAVPAQFKVWPEPPPPGIDKRKVLAAFNAGQTVPGCSVTQGERVEIIV
jgi:hypothetical protein